MATDAFYFQGNIQYGNGRDSWVKQIAQMAITQTSTIKSAGSQSVGSAAHEALRMGDVTSPSICFVRNLSDDYPVQIGVEVAATFYPVIELEAGDDLPLIGRFHDSATIYVKGNGGAVEIDFAVFQKDA